MKLYRFSPIKNEKQLLKAIKYTHFACFELCKKVFDRYLPVAGNIGIFCHYDEEYKFLTKLREKLTDSSNNFNQKYFRLYKPITIRAKGNVPKTIYTHLYIRRPDQYRAQTGDVDFILEKGKHNELKKLSLQNTKVNGIKIHKLTRPGIENLIELSHPDIEALAYLTIKSLVNK
jgi:hypothetical protein